MIIWIIVLINFIIDVYFLNKQINNIIVNCSNVIVLWHIVLCWCCCVCRWTDRWLPLWSGGSGSIMSQRFGVQERKRLERAELRHHELRQHPVRHSHRLPVHHHGRMDRHPVSRELWCHDFNTSCIPSKSVLKRKPLTPQCTLARERARSLLSLNNKLNR